jgi:DNA invertase Pin-like site-specific DNA recombinase
MNKITTQHLERVAYVYVRQSTLYQVQHHKESQHVQYGLANRAKALGWQVVKIIDDDLGISGTGQVKRPGFEKLLSDICQGHVGAVFAMEASRLARNGREWHTLLDMCGLVKTLIIDLDSIYDPSTSNDRLLLGMKGTLSEMELSLFKQRSQQAMREKASRGEFYSSVVIGYLVNGKYLEKDPNQRIQQAIFLVFSKFKELSSVRQVLLWLRQENITMPAKNYQQGERIVEWRLPVYNTILNILENPIYAGCYAYGRTVTQIKVLDGKKKVVRGVHTKQSDWQVLIKDHHEGYISWEEYEMNQKTITHNANMKGAMVRGSVKKGQALLGGLLRCGRCGRKMLAHYAGHGHARYQCKGALQNHGAPRCIGFGGLRVDEKISELLLEVISPLSIESSLQAIKSLEVEKDELRNHHLLELKQARYEAGRIERQYASVEPENRLVALELEKRWEESLEKVANCEKSLSSLPTQKNKPDQKDKDFILNLGKNLGKLWYSENTSITFKKQVARTLLEEIIADITEDTVKLIIHWQGGVHTECDVKKNKKGHHRFVTSEEVIKLIEQLARYMSDSGMASLLTRLGKKTATGLTWNEARIRTFRDDHNIAVYKKNEHHQRGELMVAEVSKKLGIPTHSVIRLIKNNHLPAKQVCKSAPWIIEEKAINNNMKQKKKLIALTEKTNQEFFDFLTT